MNRLTEARAKLEWVTRSARAEQFRARAPRAAFLGCVAITSILGVKAIVSPARSTRSDTAASSSVDLAAEGYALQFARAYLSGGDRVDLRRFLPVGLTRAASSHSAARPEAVDWAQISSDEPDPSGGRLITVAAGLGSGSSASYLAVPVSRAASGALRIERLPAFVGVPSTVATASSRGRRVANPAVLAVVKRVLANYLSDRSSRLASGSRDGAAISDPRSWASGRFLPRPALGGETDVQRRPRDPRRDIAVWETLDVDLRRRDPASLDPSSLHVHRDRSEP